MATGAGLAEWKQTHGKKKVKCVLTSTGLLMEGLLYQSLVSAQVLANHNSADVVVVVHEKESLFVHLSGVLPDLIQHKLRNHCGAAFVQALHVPTLTAHPSLKTLLSLLNKRVSMIQSVSLSPFL
jgi:hypothetical protein